MVRRLPFGEEMKRRVAEAVAAAEVGTSGEIVVVVHRRAGRYGDTLAVLSVIGASVLYLLGMGGPALLGSSTPQWTASTDRLPSPIWGLLVWTVGFVGVWFLFESAPSLLRPFVSRERRAKEAEGAAWRAFGERGVRRTQGGTGVLLFVGEFEKTVAVLGDRAIDAELEPADWKRVRDLVLAGYGRGRPAEGLLAGIAEAGALLARHFPASPDEEPGIGNEPHLTDGS